VCISRSTTTAFLSEDSRDAAEASYCAASRTLSGSTKSCCTPIQPTRCIRGIHLLDYAKKLKLDTDKFSECLKSDRNLAKLDEIMRYANSLGIDSTPQFSVNGTIVYMNTLNETVDKALLR
jgi:hypothetical protein